MVDVFEVAEVFVSHAVRAHGDEIGIIAYYGSYAQGMPSPTSDLDLIYIPDDGKAAELPICFLLEGICFDFFPISWQLAERLASGQDSWAVGPALIATAQILYARAEADMARFRALQSHIRQLQSPENRPMMVERALTAFTQALAQLGSLRLALLTGDRESVRRAGWSVVMVCVECLALVNQVYFLRGWDSNLKEILRLGTRPDNLEEMITTIALSPAPERIAAAAEALVGATRAILLREQQALASDQQDSSHFANYYPELRDKINKIQARCESGNLVGASWAAMFVQEETARFVAQDETAVPYSDINLYADYASPYRRLGFPPLMCSLAETDGRLLAEQASAFDAQVQTWLNGRGISLNCVRSSEELKALLQAKETRV